MWGDDDEHVQIFEVDSVRTVEARAVKQITLESLVWAPVLWTWISSTRELTAGDAFRFWAQCQKKWGGNQLLVGRDVGAEVGMLVVPSRYASQDIILDAGGYCGELQDVQDSGCASTCYVKWLCSGTKGGPYHLPNRWMEDVNASAYQLAVPSEQEKERARDYANEIEYERSMAEARRTQLISKWQRLAEKGLFGLDVLARRTVWDLRVEKETREAERKRQEELERERQEMIARLIAEGREDEIANMPKHLKGKKKKGKKKPTIVKTLRRLPSGETVEEEVMNWSEDSDDDTVRKPGQGMKVIIPRVDKTLVKRKAKPDPGPFPHDLCCRQLEQNELFCLPSASQKMITADKAKAHCVLVVCSHRATSPSGQYKAFPLRKALQAGKCCQLIVRDCTDEAVLSKLLDELVDSLDDRYNAKLAAATDEAASAARFGLSRASSRFSMGFSRQSSAKSVFSRRASSRVLSRQPSARRRLSPLSSRLPSQASSISVFRPSKADESVSTVGGARLPQGGRRSRRGSVQSVQSAKSVDGWRPGQAVPGMELPDLKYDIEMLLLQRVDLLRLKGVRKLLTALQHEECKIETLICIRTHFGDEGARLLSKAMLGKRTCEEGTITPIPGVTLGWRDMKHEDTIHDGRADLGIKTLVLQQCGINEKGALHFAEAMQRNNTIALLDLSGNRIGKSGVQALARALVRPSPLNYLGLHGNGQGVDADAIRWLEEAIARRWHVIQAARREEEAEAAIRQSFEDGLEQQAADAAGGTSNAKPAEAQAASANTLVSLTAEQAMQRMADSDAREDARAAEVTSLRSAEEAATEEEEGEGGSKCFTLVTGSLEMPVVLRSFEPPEEQGWGEEAEHKGMQRGPEERRWQAFDKRWTGIMEWQVRQKGWEEGRRGWSLVRPERKRERLEELERERELERQRLEELARKKALLEEQWWREHAEAEGYQFLHFNEEPGAAKPGFESPLAGRPRGSWSPPNMVSPLRSAVDGSTPSVELEHLAARPGTAPAAEKTRETVASSQSKETLLSTKDTVQLARSEDFIATDFSASVVFDAALIRS